jgi:hypothetical protein
MEQAMATAVSTSQTCRNFINGRWVESSDCVGFEAPRSIDFTRRKRKSNIYQPQ